MLQKLRKELYQSRGNYDANVGIGPNRQKNTKDKNPAFRMYYLTKDMS